MHVLIEFDKAEVVDLFLKRQPDLSKKNGDGRTPLHFAVCCTHPHIVKRLLAAGAKADTADVNGRTPLHDALRDWSPDDPRYAHRMELAEELVKAGAKLDARDKTGTGLLHGADPAAARFLLRHKIDLGIKDKAGNTALHTAAGHRDNRSFAGEEKLLVLLAAGADVQVKNEAGQTPFDVAVKAGNYPSARLIAEKMKPSPDVEPLKIWPEAHYQRKHYLEVKSALDNGADVNGKDQNGNPLVVAAALGREEALVDLLIAHGADVNATGKNGQTALRLAVERGSFLITRALLEAKARPNRLDSGQFLLHVPCEKGMVEIARLLLRAGVDVEATIWDDHFKKTRSPLYLAIGNGDLTMVELLLEHKVKVNFRDGWGNLPPLCAAWELKQRAIFERLLACKDIDVNLGSLHGKNMLHLAAWDGDVAVVKDLLARGMDVNAVERGAYTPLHWAVWGSHLEVIKLLIAHGADVSREIKNKEGRLQETPLHEAVRSSSPDSLAVVEYLLSKGASINARNPVGETPLHRGCRVPRPSRYGPVAPPAWGRHQRPRQGRQETGGSCAGSGVDGDCQVAGALMIQSRWWPGDA